jgi:hypothetical protein
MKNSEMTFEKRNTVARRRSRGADIFKLARSGRDKIAGDPAQTQNFFRALTEAAFSSPQTPVLKRFHD